MCTAARRSGAIVDTDKKISAGGNKAHQGTDHQRIAKLDRENEVAPPPKIAPSVGKVHSTHFVSRHNIEFLSII
jgi:putative transcription factor